MQLTRQTWPFRSDTGLAQNFWSEQELDGCSGAEGSIQWVFCICRDLLQDHLWKQNSKETEIRGRGWSSTPIIHLASRPPRENSWIGPQASAPCLRVPPEVGSTNWKSLLATTAGPSVVQAQPPQIRRTHCPASAPMRPCAAGFASRTYLPIATACPVALLHTSLCSRSRI